MRANYFFQSVERRNWYLSCCYSPYKSLCELPGRHLKQPFAKFCKSYHPDSIRRDFPIKDPFPGFTVFKSLCKEVVKFEYIDTPLLHYLDQVIVLDFCPRNPNDIIEQKFPAVFGCKPHMGKSRATNYNFAKFSY